MTLSSLSPWLLCPDDGLRNKKGELIQKQDLTVDMESQEKLPGPANGEGPECGDTREPEGWTERHHRNALMSPKYCLTHQK